MFNSSWIALVMCVVSGCSKTLKVLDDFAADNVKYIMKKLTIQYLPAWVV